MSNFLLPSKEFDKFKSECLVPAHGNMLHLTVAKGGDMPPPLQALEPAASTSYQIKMEKVWPVLAKYRFMPYEVESKQSPPKQQSLLKPKEDPIPKPQVSLLKKPKTYKDVASSLVVKPPTEWPKPIAYNGKTLIYYGSIAPEEESSEDDDSDDEDADVDVVGVSDLEEESAIASDGIDHAEVDVEGCVSQMAMEVDRIYLEQFPTFAQFVRIPEDVYEEDEEDEDDEEAEEDDDDEGYEDMDTGEEDDEAEENEEMNLVYYPNSLGPCAEIERIVESDISRSDALDRIVAQL